MKPSLNDLVNLSRAKVCLSFDQFFEFVVIVLFRFYDREEPKATFVCANPSGKTICNISTV